MAHTSPIIYFVDEESEPKRFYSAFLQDNPDYVTLVNVEEPAEPVYCMSIWDLFYAHRFREINITLDRDYLPTHFRINRSRR